MVREEVSVIIVNYNAGEMLTKCVANVLNSSVPVRVYISDNASSDNSLDLLLNNYPNDPRLIIHRNSKNLGFSAGNNCVFPMIKTPYILFLNPDCFIDPNTIEHLTANLDSIPEAAITGCLIKNIDGTEQAGCRGLTPTPLRIFSQLFKLNKQT